MREIIIEIPSNFGKTLKAEKVNAEIKGEIVRCKDCKEGVLCNGDTAYVCSKCIGSLETIVHPGEWYCADGERRTDK